MFVFLCFDLLQGFRLSTTKVPISTIPLQRNRITAVCTTDCAPFVEPRFTLRRLRINHNTNYRQHRPVNTSGLSFPRVYSIVRSQSFPNILPVYQSLQLRVSKRACLIANLWGRRKMLRSCGSTSPTPRYVLDTGSSGPDMYLLVGNQ